MKATTIKGWNVLFNEEQHQYLDTDGIIPGVSGILKAMGKIKHYNTKDTTARDRGTRIHQAIELMDSLGLSPLDFDEAGIHPYLTAWNNWQMEAGVEMLAIERMVGHGEWRYAGMTDRVASINGGVWIVDLKTGSAADWHRLQLAAYATAYEWETGEEIAGGIAVYPKPTGKYTTKPVTGMDWTIVKQEWLTLARNYRSAK